MLAGTVEAPHVLGTFEVPGTSYLPGTTRHENKKGNEAGCRIPGFFVRVESASIAKNRCSLFEVTAEISPPLAGILFTAFEIYSQNRKSE